MSCSGDDGIVYNVGTRKQGNQVPNLCDGKLGAIYYKSDSRITDEAN